MDATLEAAGASGTKPSPAMRIALAGRWVETFVGGGEGVARYQVALSELKVAGDEVPRVDLQTPFYVEVDGTGAVQGFYFARSTTARARGILKSTVAVRQVLLRNSHEWRTRELDPTGEYEALYTRPLGSREVHKRRSHYTRLATARGLRPTADVGSAEIEDDTRIALTADEELAQLDANAHTKVRTGDGLPTAIGSLHASFVLRDEAVDVSKLGAFEASQGALERVEMVTTPELAPMAEAWRESDAQVVGTATLADLVDALAKVPSEDRRARAEAMAKLRADFRLRPEDTQKAAAVVGTTSVDAGKAITAALGGAGTPPAQRALVTVVDDARVSLPVRLNASTALLLLEQPTTATARELQRQMGDPNEHIRGASSLALGSVLRQLDDAAAREEALRTLVANFEGTTNPSDRVHALRALGNSGDAQVLPIAWRAYADEVVAIRMAAVDAVRFVSGADAEALLAKAMLEDPEPRVRIEAIEIVTAHRFVPKYVTTYDAILRAQQFPLVRRAAVQSLSKASGSPQAIALLQRALEDPSEDVRAVARFALNSRSPG